jgi:hypothetical protein
MQQPFLINFIIYPGKFELCIYKHKFLLAVVSDTKTKRRKFTLPKLSLDAMKFRSENVSTDQEPTTREVPVISESPNIPEKPPPEVSTLSTPTTPKRFLIADLKGKRGRRRSKSEAALKEISFNTMHPDAGRRSITMDESHSPSVNVSHKKRRHTSTCDCLTKGEHYPNVALDTTFTGSVEKIYNLLFTSGFMRQFLEENEKCTGQYKSYR